MTNTKQRERLKSLLAMMLRWAEKDKKRFVGAVYNTWKKEFKYVIRLENKQENGVMESLSRIHMIECNKLFKEYRC